LSTPRAATPIHSGSSLITHNQVDVVRMLLLIFNITLASSRFPRASTSSDGRLTLNKGIEIALDHGRYSSMPFAFTGYRKLNGGPDGTRTRI